MAGSRKSADEALIATLASGASVQAAAKLCDVSESTVFRRLKDPEFKHRLASARSDMVERALGHLAKGSTEAAVTLRRLLRKAKDDRVKLGAARAILELGGKLRETVELAGEIEELRQLLEGAKK